MNTIRAALIVAVCVSTTPLLAGSLDDPVVAPEVVVEQAKNDSDNVHGALAAFAVITIILGMGL